MGWERGAMGVSSDLLGGQQYFGSSSSLSLCFYNQLKPISVGYGQYTYLVYAGAIGGCENQ